MPTDNIDNEKAKRIMLKIAKARLEAAAIFLVGSIKENLSVPARTVKFKTGRDGKTRKVLGARGSERSKPGEFPRKDTGALRASVTWDGPKETAEGLVVRIGSPLRYGKYLEFGTSGKHAMRARPWLRKSLKEDQETIRQICEHGERSQISVKS